MPINYQRHPLFLVAITLTYCEREIEELITETIDGLQKSSEVPTADELCMNVLKPASPTQVFNEKSAEDTTSFCNTLLIKLDQKIIPKTNLLFNFMQAIAESAVGIGHKFALENKDLATIRTKERNFFKKFLQSSIDEIFMRFAHNTPPEEIKNLREFYRNFQEQPFLVLKTTLLSSKEFPYLFNIFIDAGNNCRDNQQYVMAVVLSAIGESLIDINLSWAETVLAQALNTGWPFAKIQYAILQLLYKDFFANKENLVKSIACLEELRNLPQPENLDIYRLLADYFSQKAKNTWQADDYNKAIDYNQLIIKIVTAQGLTSSLKLNGILDIIDENLAKDSAERTKHSQFIELLVYYYQENPNPNKFAKFRQLLLGYLTASQIQTLAGNLANHDFCQKYLANNTPATVLITTIEECLVSSMQYCEIGEALLVAIAESNDQILLQEITANLVHIAELMATLLESLQQLCGQFSITPLLEDHYPDLEQLLKYYNRVFNYPLFNSLLNSQPELQDKFGQLTTKIAQIIIVTDNLPLNIKNEIVALDKNMIFLRNRCITNSQEVQEAIDRIKNVFTEIKKHSVSAVRT